MINIRCRHLALTGIFNTSLLSATLLFHDPFNADFAGETPWSFLDVPTSWFVPDGHLGGQAHYVNVNNGFSGLMSVSPIPGRANLRRLNNGPSLWARPIDVDVPQLDTLYGSYVVLIGGTEGLDQGANYELVVGLDSQLSAAPMFQSDSFFGVGPDVNRSNQAEAGFGGFFSGGRHAAPVDAMPGAVRIVRGVQYLVLFRVQGLSPTGSTEPRPVTLTYWVVNTAQFETLKQNDFATIDVLPLGAGAGTVMQRATWTGERNWHFSRGSYLYMYVATQLGAPLNSINSFIDEIRLGTSLAAVTPVPAAAIECPAEGWQNDPAVGLIYNYGNCWAFWAAAPASPWGYLYLGEHSGTDGSWIYHATQGWLFHAAGLLTDDEAIWLYSPVLGWVAASTGFPAGTYYRLATQSHEPW
jgi:hypothetical protein